MAVMSLWAWALEDMYQVHLPEPPQALQTSILPKPSQTLHSVLPRPIMTWVPQYMQWALSRSDGNLRLAPHLGHTAGTSSTSAIPFTLGRGGIGGEVLYGFTGRSPVLAGGGRWRGG